MERLSPREQGDLGEFSAIEWDGRRWFIPAAAVEGTTKIVLGGPKYSEFEVDRGRALPIVAAA